MAQDIRRLGVLRYSDDGFIVQKKTAKLVPQQLTLSTFIDANNFAALRSSCKMF